MESGTQGSVLMRKVANVLRQARGLDHALHFDGALILDELADCKQQRRRELFGRVSYWSEGTDKSRSGSGLPLNTICTASR
jgi:hypothetical protein